MGLKRTAVDMLVRLPFAVPIIPSKKSTQRRLHAYGVGLPRSGTHSIAALLSNYRAVHEPAVAVTTHQIMLYHSGCRSYSHFCRFLRYRDEALYLEFEASHFLVYAAQAVAELFPKSKFIFTVRSPTSWIRSERNQNQSTLQSDGVWREYELFRYRGIKPWERQGDRATELFTIDQYLEYWKFHCRTVLDAVPSDRLLVVPTKLIGSMLNTIADFLEIPRSSVWENNLHKSNKKHIYEKTVEEVDRELVERSCGEFIRTHFPTMAEYLL